MGIDISGLSVEQWGRQAFFRRFLSLLADRKVLLPKPVTRDPSLMF